MNWLEIFGFITMVLMLVFYTLEHRSRVWILAFTISCAMASVYAAMIGSVPFAIVEAIWVIVALWRWWKAGK